MLKKMMFVAALSPLAMTAVAHADSITVAAWGGSYQDALRASFFEPTAKELGITIAEDNLSTGLADIRLQVQGKSVRWDLVDISAEECVAGEKEGLFEPLDYNIVKSDGIDKRLVGKSWIGFVYYSVVLAHNTNSKEATPKNWKDFFDTKGFPGRRSLGNFPSETLTIAAMADGTHVDKVYPIDLDKAFAKLEELKPNITAWWSSGTQATNLIMDNEVDYGSSWNGRIATLKASGAPVDWVVEGGVLNADCLVIPKGAKNKDLAMKALARFVSPDLQANLPKHAANGPVNVKAFETGKLTREEAAKVISSPENLKKQVLLDPQFWGDNIVGIQARWQNLVQ
ncbi:MULTISPECIES: ABC transporter substrate-binding protein [Mesorhizobium]|uniref:ABC transporter substrate-binding protein n=1 Tax=Mesorhizobium TaxID=68287 RepID=UPI0010A96784|nr:MULTISPECIES: ABC transporter substrate-binding protein [Mesorhizobium]